MPDIRYHSLKFKNGYAYRECEIQLDQQGLVLVRGLNLDDGGFLGAGKTSPFEIFSLLQTGRVGKQRPGERMLADDVININVGNAFEAKLRFDVGGNSYEIIQYRKHPRHGNAYQIIDVDTGRNILPGKNRTYPHKWVSKEILSVDEKSFFNLVYLAQDFSNVMLYGTEGDRQQNLIQMFGLDIYDKLLDHTKTRLSALRHTAQDVDALQDELRDIQDELQQLKHSPELIVTTLATKRAELLEQRQLHDTALSSLEHLQDMLRKVEQRSQLIGDVKKLWKSVSLPLERPQDVTKEFADRLDQEAIKAADREVALRSSIQLLDQRKILERRLSSLGSCDPESTETELEDIRSQLRKLINEDLPQAEQRTEIAGDLRSLQRPACPAADIQVELDDAKDERRQTEKLIANVEHALKNEVCPTCGQALQGSTQNPKELQRSLRNHRQALKKASAQVHDLTAELTNARRYEELQERLQKLGAMLRTQDIQQEIGRLSREEKRLVTLLEAENLRQTLQQQLASMPKDSPEQLKSRCSKAEQRKKRLRRQHAVASDIVIKLAKIMKLPKGKVAAVRGRVLTATRQVREASSAMVQIGEDVGRFERLNDRIQNLLKRKRKIRDGLQKTKQTRADIECLEALKVAFGPKGLKRDRFAAILRDATEQTVPYYTKLLWPKRNAEVSLAELNTGVRFALQRSDFVTDSRLLSGGERNKAGLALLFGMRDLKEKYTGLRTNVLVVDEPFGNLDAYGTDNLIRVLQDQRDRFGTVIVIGNQRDVLNHRSWDQVWWVVREDHEAKLYKQGLPQRYLELADRYHQLEA